MDKNRSVARRRTTGAVVAGVLLIAVGLAVALAQPQPRQAYSNQVPLDGPVAQVPPGAEACQFDESVPADAPSVGVVLHGRPGRVGPFDLTIRDPDLRPVATSTVGPGRPGRRGLLSFPLPGRNPELPVASICVRNRGRALVTLTGAPEPKIPAATPVLPAYGPLPAVDGRPQPGPFTIGYGAGGTEPAVALLPELVRRAGLVKSALIGSWTIWLALAAALALAAVALLAVLRSQEP